MELQYNICIKMMPDVIKETGHFSGQRRQDQVKHIVMRCAI